ncbi:MAG: glycosyltransferase family 2 protein [Gammaproteobacteria bacterium]|nr:glycosyltransferase family 2 protein [Gammaproteobacteria bacterium]
MSEKLSIVLPSKNEGKSLELLLPKLKSCYSSAEIIVIDDGSDDNTGVLCADHAVTHVRHTYSKGNGAAIKSGARAATGDIIVFMDADGQHNPEDIPKLLEPFKNGADMVIGARKASGQASVARLFANSLYNRLASLLVGHRIEDLTSGFRAVRRELFLEFLHLLPNGFSYPTTITMCFFRAGYTVLYTPIETAKRIGRSHINLLRDGARFLIIIFKIATLYSPLKLFLPISLVHFTVASGYYFYTYTMFGRFTNMSALLFVASILIFLIGLVSEQITALLYKNRD